MTITFWGARGSLPVPGPHTLRYGGNTACVSVEIDGKVLVLDAGTGMFELGQTLLGAGKDVFVLLSHLHSDHTQGLPFFAPLYQPSGLIYLLDYEHDGQAWSPLDLFDGVHHPLRKDMLPAECLRVRGDALAHLAEHGFAVERTRLNHAGGAYGYRITHAGRAFVYMTDNELVMANGADVRPSPYPDPISFERLAAFCADADVLCHDAQYRAAEMPLRRGWGHSQLPDVCRLAEVAGVKHLVLFHHDPLRTDEALDALLRDRHVLGPHRLGEGRAVRPLVHMAVGRDGHHQHVAERLGRLEVADVADVQEVEAPVAEHDPPARLPLRVQPRGDLVEVADRPPGHRRAACRWFLRVQHRPRPRGMIRVGIIRPAALSSTRGVTAVTADFADDADSDRR